MKYDIIGDIHGQSKKLIQLLEVMGYDYSSQKQCWGHSDRKIMFVGDFVDRGPNQLETLEIVKTMIDNNCAEAVMGNHEYNAIAFFEKDPLNENEYLRKRDEKNYSQHIQFLNEVGEDSQLHKYWIDWFYTLPLFIEKEYFRTIHACWHKESIEFVKQYLDKENKLNTKFVELSSRKKTSEYKALEILCKGMEIQLPEEIVFIDKQGIRRKRSRLAWWDDNANTYKNSCVVGHELKEKLPDTEIPKHKLVNYSGKPVFFGHYWMKGEPDLLSNNMCCVDYSAGIGDNSLVAYRFDGEEFLNKSKFISNKDFRNQLKLK